MKFAHEFQAALIREGYPPHWVESAVQYGPLKKIIKKVTLELESLGLDSATLARLVPEQNPDSPLSTTPAKRGSSVAFKYDFNGVEEAFEPRLTLFLKNGVAVDAALSPDTRRYLENLVHEQENHPETRHEESPCDQNSVTESPSVSAVRSQESTDKPVIQRIEVPLSFDAEFFKTLQGEVAALGTLQAGEQTAIADEIVTLSRDITSLTKPSRFAKTDMYRWRELFDIYLQAMVFFSTHELDHGTRDSNTAAKQLEWFQGEVMRRNIVQSFKLPASRQALERFVNINITLLLNIKFQEINRTAVNKILKKFDKRTRLGATRNFPKLIYSKSTMSETMAKAVCSQLTQDLVRTVPQIDDYLCPVCFTIAWRPVRMKCQHILCISCAVTLQRKRERFCPLCRGDVVLEADADNIDPALEHFLEKYFPKESREKRIVVETERGKEQFGESYKHPSEQKCSVM